VNRLNRLHRTDWRGIGFFLVGMGLGVMVTALSACSDPDSTVRTLKSHGFTDISTTGFDAFECGQEDAYSTGFTATNPAGQRVTGVVCCGWLSKGCTVRF
jgi:hypothetical protein